MKKLLYYSCVCPEKTYKMLFQNYEIMPGQQVQKYHRTMLEGLASQKDVTIQAISKVPFDIKKVKKLITRPPKENWKGIQFTYLPFLKIPKIGRFFQIISAFWETLFIKKESEIYALIDVLNISLGIGAIWACKLRKIPMIGIVTDLPQYLVENSNSFFVKSCNRIINQCEAYVVLTEQMNAKINPTGKPYVVIEGQVDPEMVNFHNTLENKYAKRVCLYSGNLNADNGIDYLVEGFIKANIENTELYIYGNGDYVPELKKICEEQKQIRYMGVKLNEEVVAAQIKATLLINPRPTHQEFVKYSFPSKNMEYMASGTPMLTTKLPGMPKEYYPYVYFLEEETAEGIAEVLRDLFQKSRQELHEKGVQAKQFVLTKKTGIVQAEKIIQMLKLRRNRYAWWGKMKVNPRIMNKQ